MITNYKAGAFWYGWYRTNTWDNSSTRALPFKGKYNSLDPNIIDAQINEAEANKLSVFAAEYYYRSDGSYTDPEIHLLGQRLEDKGSTVKFLLFYDQAISLLNHCPEMDKKDLVNFNHPMENIRICINNSFREDFVHMRNEFFDANLNPIYPNYLRFRNNTKNAFFIYITRSWQGEVSECPFPNNCSYHKAVFDIRGSFSGKIYIIGDEMHGSGNYNDNRIDELDAVSAYGTAGAKIYDMSHTVAVADSSINNQIAWRNHVNSIYNEYTGEKVNFMPSAMASYEDDHSINRSKERDFYDDNGAGFGYFLKRAKDISIAADSNTAFIWINSFNEWWETSAIEPSQSTPNISCKAPNNCFRFAWQDIYLKEVLKIFGSNPGPAPVISNLSKDTFGVSENVDINIYGNNFISSGNPKSWVIFSPLGASDVNVISSNTLVATTPTYEGRIMETPVKVVNPDGQISNYELVNFVPLQLEWASPPAVCPGNNLNIVVSAVNILEGLPDVPDIDEQDYIKSVNLTISLPSCFTLISGSQTQTLTYIYRYSRKQVQWTVQASSVPNCTPNLIRIIPSNVRFCHREKNPNPPPTYFEICWLNSDVGWTPVELKENVSIKNPTFADVGCNHLFFGYIERLYEKGIAGGCSSNPLKYCPDNYITREQMAKFITNARGDTYLENPCISQFKDVSNSSLFCPYIENIKNQGLVMGSCSSSNWYFCPSNYTSRETMAIWTVLGIERRPGDLIWNFFSDITGDDLKERLIEKGYVLGIYEGCSSSPPLFCPNDNLTRAQMAKFIVHAWNL